MSLWLAILLLVIGFALLIWGADFFVDGASRVAARLKIPQIVIGLTIVAFGTSAPEAAVSISAGLKGSADLAVSNVVGSNILNIGIILGISALITPLAVQKATRKYEMPYVMIVTIILMLLGMFDGKLGWVDGLILWAGMILFLVYLLNIAKKGKNEEQEEEQNEKKKKAPLIWLIGKILIGGVAIVLGSDFAVDGATAIATSVGWSERLIGLTIVALGTSLPELVTSVVAAMKKNADIAIGNIVGSNIFNILFVLGTTALLTPVAYTEAFIIDNIVALVIAVLLWVLVLNKDCKLKRIGGGILLVSYVIYFVYLMINPFGYGV
ncbi:MAG: calcium/sodium antiporter [Lachnospiraceae bacterium]|nr:calcium/sodium antiporter [Lachnospiraceae bacterium]MBQ8247935.1 calcium/sodium antiporter [Lachnospiraceae bacterium]